MPRGGLAERPGTEFTWSPQLRNLAEWDWVPIFLHDKYGGECRHGRTMSFCLVLRFPASKHQCIFWTSGGMMYKQFKGDFSWFGIPASSVMFKLREIYELPAWSISYIFPLTAVLRLSSYPRHVLRAHCISMSLATVICECSLNQFSSSLFVSLFVQLQWEPSKYLRA